MTSAIPRALAVLLLVLGTSLPAHAHDESHPPAEIHHADAGGHIAGSAHHRVSPSCPGAPGHLCCCGSLVALSGHGKVSVVDVAGWEPAVRAVSAEKVAHRSFPSPKPAAPSRARPRAPPVSS